MWLTARLSWGNQGRNSVDCQRDPLYQKMRRASILWRVSKAGWSFDEEPWQGSLLFFSDGILASANAGSNEAPEDPASLRPSEEA